MSGVRVSQVVTIDIWMLPSPGAVHFYCTHVQRTEFVVDGHYTSWSAAIFDPFKSVDETNPFVLSQVLGVLAHSSGDSTSSRIGLRFQRVSHTGWDGKICPGVMPLCEVLGLISCLYARPE